MRPVREPVARRRDRVRGRGRRGRRCRRRCLDSRAAEVVCPPAGSGFPKPVATASNATAIVTATIATARCVLVRIADAPITLPRSAPASFVTTTPFDTARIAFAWSDDAPVGGGGLCCVTPSARDARHVSRACATVRNLVNARVASGDDFVTALPPAERPDRGMDDCARRRADDDTVGRWAGRPGRHVRQQVLRARRRRRSWKSTSPTTRRRRPRSSSSRKRRATSSPIRPASATRRPRTRATSWSRSPAATWSPRW